MGGCAVQTYFITDLIMKWYNYMRIWQSLVFHMLYIANISFLFDSPLCEKFWLIFWLHNYRIPFHKSRWLIPTGQICSAIFLECCWIPYFYKRPMQSWHCVANTSGQIICCGHVGTIILVPHHFSQSDHSNDQARYFSLFRKPFWSFRISFHK